MDTWFSIYTVFQKKNVAVHYILFQTTAGVCCCEGGQFEHELWLVVQQCRCNCAFWLCRLIVWLSIKFLPWLFSVFFDSFSHMQPLWSVITHFVWNLLQTVTPKKITPANQHFYVLVNIFTFNELWNVTFCHKIKLVCNVRRQNSCDEFCKVE